MEKPEVIFTEDVPEFQSWGPDRTRAAGKAVCPDSTLELPLGLLWASPDCIDRRPLMAGRKPEPATPEQIELARRIVAELRDRRPYLRGDR